MLARFLHMSKVKKETTIMSDEKKTNEENTEEIMAEMQELMKRQMELQAKLLKSNWNGFNDALGAFMGMFNDLSKDTTENKEESEDKDK
jgi:galactokinase/mevalonate kinase-like predicted kinase